MHNTDQSQLVSQTTK